MTVLVTGGAGPLPLPLPLTPEVCAHGGSLCKMHDPQEIPCKLQ
jgi:hypothetical protein